MSDGRFDWWAGQGNHPEMYQGPFDSREQAIQQMVSEDGELYGYTVCEADKQIISFNIFDAGDVVERLEEHNDECWGEEGINLAFTTGQSNELEKLLGETVKQFLQSRNLLPEVWAFGVMRNMEYFPPTIGSEVPVDG